MLSQKCTTVMRLSESRVKIELRSQAFAGLFTFLMFFVLVWFVFVFFFQLG